MCNGSDKLLRKLQCSIFMSTAVWHFPYVITYLIVTPDLITDLMSDYWDI